MNTRRLGTVVASLGLSAACAHADFTYAIDDGDPDLGIGPPNGSSFIALNQFSVAAGQSIVTEILVQFFGPSSFQLPNPATAYLWSDPNGDGLPGDAQILASIDGLAQGQIGFTSFDIPDTAIGPEGTSFFVGVMTTDDPNLAGLPSISVDTTPILPGRSFTLVGNLLDPTGLGGATDLANLNRGPLHIRAVAVPAPPASAFVVLGLAGMRRRQARERRRAPVAG